LDVGDAVCGLTDWYRDGFAAEYVAVEARNLAPKPAALDNVGAAVVPMGALTAWQAPVGLDGDQLRPVLGWTFGPRGRCRRVRGENWGGIAGKVALMVNADRSWVRPVGWVVR
jgi:NADPH:quinone reductase-like Zn-dependent oxidoreductase